MSHPAFITKTFGMKPEVNKIFDDLDDYRDFCVEFGYNFNPAHLYNKKSPWGDMQKYLSGKKVINNWKIDGEQEA